MNRPSPVTVRCTWFDCNAHTPLFEPDDGWIRDASGDWCPDHAPDTLPLDDLTEDH